MVEDGGRVAAGEEVGLCGESGGTGRPVPVASIAPECGGIDEDDDDDDDDDERSLVERERERTRRRGP